MDAFRSAFYLSALMVLSLEATEVVPVSSTPSTPSEAVVTRPDPGPAQVTGSGEELTRQDLQVEVLSQEAGSSLSRGDQPSGTMASSGKIVDPTPEANLRELNTIPTSPDLNREDFPKIDRRELEKWRRLSTYPIHLTLVNGVLKIEWAGVQKSSPMINNQEILLQLAPP